MPDKKYQLIVIGGSAGSLREIWYILKSISDLDAVPPILIVIHLHASTGSLVDYFSDISHSKFVIQMAYDKDPVKFNHVYIAPANYHLLLEKNMTISLSIDEKVNHSRPSIDVLFEAVSHVCVDRAISVLLSGANADGAEGLFLLKKQGSYIIVQDPDTAEFNEMPRFALNRVNADYVSGVKELTDQLKTLIIQ